MIMENGYQTPLKPTDGAGEYNAIRFMIQQMLAKVRTATLVEVKKCTNSGGVAAVGFVDVQPLVNQVDGSGAVVPHGIIRGLPYMRLQGGANAVIIDPEIGDIGIALIADRDSSKVVSTKKAANPGSMRKFNLSDGLYLGGVLNGTPQQYVEFSSGGIKLTSGTKVTIDAPAIEAANGGAVLKLLNENLINWLTAHTHTDSVGGTTTAPLGAPPDSTMQTSILKAE